jgi:hypothetical protein
MSGNSTLMSRSLDSSFYGLSGGSPRDTRTALNRWGEPYPINFNDGINILTAQKAAPSVYQAGTPQFLQLGGNHATLAARTTHRHPDLFPLLADLHDRLHALISRTDHLKHPLVLRSSFEECGKVFVWIRVLHGGRVAALTVIDRFMDERGHSLRAIDTHGARHSPKYSTQIGGTRNPLDRDARTQPGSLFYLNTVTFIAKLSEAGCWESNHYREHKKL